MSGKYVNYLNQTIITRATCVLCASVLCVENITHAVLSHCMYNTCNLVTLFSPNRDKYEAVFSERLPWVDPVSVCAVRDVGGRDMKIHWILPREFMRP